MAVGIGVLIVVTIFLFIIAASGVRIVHPYQRGIIEQLGRFKEIKDPGLHLIIPFIQSLRTVDMREQVVDVPPQEVITSDNVVVAVDAVIYYEPTDPQRLVYNVANFILAVTKLAQTNLRNVIGDMTLDQALTSRDKLNLDLRLILDDATDKWGVKVVRVEIQRIDPPPDVMSAMHEQMKAERTRRAVVLTADGVRESAIMEAEGEKQAAILQAEGVKEQQVLEADGQAEAIRRLADAERYRQEAVALGEANAITAGVRSHPSGQPDQRPDRHQVPRGARDDGRRPRHEDLPSQRHQRIPLLPRRRRGALRRRRDRTRLLRPDRRRASPRRRRPPRRRRRHHRHPRPPDRTGPGPGAIRGDTGSIVLARGLKRGQTHGPPRRRLGAPCRPRPPRSHQQTDDSESSASAWER